MFIYLVHGRWGKMGFCYCFFLIALSTVPMSVRSKDSDSSKMWLMECQVCCHSVAMAYPASSACCTSHVATVCPSIFCRIGVGLEQLGIHHFHVLCIHLHMPVPSIFV